ncbi:MAG TPA: SDR family NAD(P)-dependent oxidoreductase, partial [Candidatus Ozemobacteraceae bacterium]|nr:SDR family NAD(P)-dependent oxidoreductase [Candidatus Ozemobacteraceae bacterium]
MSVVSEKTGYPAEMLNLDMDMESDLGIDSIKRVEIMSGFQEKMPNAPVVQPGDLGKFRTLRQIIEFLKPVGTAPTVSLPTPSVSAPVTSSRTAAGTDTGAAPSQIEQTLLQVVSEKTGYPVEMLNPDMDMEADLGIDSIKRVEILSGFQEKVPSAPVVQPGDLGKFRTLGQILLYLKGSPAVGSASAHNVTQSQPVQMVAGASAVVPEKALRRVVLTVQEGGASERPFVKLPAGGVIALTDDGTPLTGLVAKAIEKRGFQTIVVPLDDSNPGVVSDQACGLVILAPVAAKAASASWTTASEEALKKAFFLTQRFAPGLTAQASDQGALLATVSRLDGAFGLKRAGRELDPVWGGLAGLAKTAAREWPEVAVKAIDLDRSLKPEEAVDLLVSELFVVGPVEIGLQAGKRWVPTEQELVIAEEKPVQSPFQSGDVVIITGGARGVTAEVACALAEAWKPTLVLCGRSALPGEEPAWLRGVEGEKPMKEAILAQARREGRQMTPKDLEIQYQKVCGEREILTTLQRVRQLGAAVAYKSLDVRREDEVKRVMAEVRAEFGTIRGLVHGAGVLRDRRILEKTRDQFDAVFDTKVTGLRNLLQVLANDDLRVIALFSSVTGRYGRIGQVDYSMANEVLNKSAQKLAAARPECRVVSFNWGPWEGGMVTPSLRKVFHDEGVGLIPLVAGGRFFVRELGAGGREDVEIVVGESLPNSAPSPMKEPPTVSTESILAGVQTGSALPPNTAGKRFFSAFEHQLSLNEDKVLNHHIMNGDPVLPMAMVIELLAHGALHENPGFLFHGFNQLRILRGVVMHGRSEYTLRVWSTKVRGNEDQPVAHVELRGGPRDREVVHASAELVLT